MPTKSYFVSYPLSTNYAYAYCRIKLKSTYSWIRSFGRDTGTASPRLNAWEWSAQSLCSSVYSLYSKQISLPTYNKNEVGISMVSIFDLNKELSKVPFADKLQCSRCNKLDARAGYVCHYTFQRFKNLNLQLKSRKYVLYPLPLMYVIMTNI